MRAVSPGSAPFRAVREGRQEAVVIDVEQGSNGEFTGVVIRAGGGLCRVGDGERVWSCRLRGRLKQGRRTARTLVVVGDRVRVCPDDPAADPPVGVVEEVLPRRNRVSRLGARRGGHVEQVLMANLDQVVAVQSVRDPVPQRGLVDRLLVAAERFGVAGVLVLNKCDLPEDPAQAARWAHYGGLGYTVLRTSVESGEGIAELGELLRDRISLLLGVSGVGKSSLLNALQPGLNLRVGDITEKTGLGRHTTTASELFPLAGGGYIADSPGIRGFDPWDVDPRDLGTYFPDFADDVAACRFRSCMHRDEPDCGVKAGVAEGRVPAWRYRAYLDLLRDLEERQERAGPQRNKP
ncbi:MAG: ribosome small subunit-dependent GTPase A [bacterium]|nr:ribosome small subunit-dependent GTPase A [bacterium]